jgi:hypothetical protein
MLKRTGILLIFVSNFVFGQTEEKHVFGIGLSGFATSGLTPNWASSISAYYRYGRHQIYSCLDTYYSIMNFPDKIIYGTQLGYNYY